MTDRLHEIYREHGYYIEETINKVLEGASGKEKIAKIMEAIRNNPPTSIGDQKVVRIDDYLSLESATAQGKIPLTGFNASSNVLIFTTEQGNQLCMRPSGTEPKIKFYFLYHGAVEAHIDIAEAGARVQDVIDKAKNTLEGWLA